MQPMRNLHWYWYLNCIHDLCRLHDLHNRNGVKCNANHLKGKWFDASYEIQNLYLSFVLLFFPSPACCCCSLCVFILVYVRPKCVYLCYCTVHVGTFYLLWLPSINSVFYFLCIYRRAQKLCRLQPLALKSRSWHLYAFVFGVNANTDFHFVSAYILTTSMALYKYNGELKRNVINSTMRWQNRESGSKASEIKKRNEKQTLGRCNLLMIGSCTKNMKLFFYRFFFPFLFLLLISSYADKQKCFR